MTDTPAQREWITRVLGFSFPDNATGEPGKLRAPDKPLLPVWTAAKDAIDVSIGKLQQAMLATGDEDMASIVKHGLYGVTAGQNVELMAALRDVDADPTPAALARLAEAVDDYRAFLAASPIVKVLESENPMVPVPFSKTLGPALDELARQVAA